MGTSARVSLNVDLGELADEPDELYALATIANVACGGHAGDETTVRRAIDRALAHHTSITAHPSYPDREGFGRRARHTLGGALARALDAQLALLTGVAAERGACVIAVKPHGALYHDVASDPELAAILLDAAAARLGDTSIIGPAEGELARLARERGVPVWREGFADRRYGADGRIVPRSELGAVLTDPIAAAAQALELARQGRFETLCLHGDSTGAVAIARAVRDALERGGLLSGRTA